MKKYLIYICLLAVSLPLQSHAKDIADRLISQYIQQYDALEKFNDENDRTGKSSQNQYIIKLSPDWIEERPGPELVILKENYEDIANILREFNGSRKDNLRFYVVVSGFFQAYVKQDIYISQLPERFENFDIDFKDLLEVKVRDSVFNLLWGNGVDKFRKGVSLALKQKGYTERALYFFSVLQLFTHDGNNTYYAIDNLKLTGELSKYSKQIRSKARQGWVSPDPIKKVDPPHLRVASAVANIINAIAIEYDAGGASSSGIVDCGKDISAIANETWKGHGTVYNDTIKAFARLLDAPSSKQKFKSEYFIIDKPENFTTLFIRDVMLPDVVFNTEILPDKIKLLAQGKCDYKVYVVFKEVDFAIPDAQRATFARDVQAQSSIASQPNTILIVVPYFSCVDNPVYAAGNGGGVMRAYPMYLMPSVYSPDPNMMLQMNSALTRQKSFRDGFNQAFKYIPKDYTAFVWSVLWNGDAIYKGAPEEYKRVTGYEDLVGIQILQDTRLDEISKANQDRNCMADGSDGETITPQDIDRVYACLAALNVDIDNILSKPADFKVLEGTSDLIQSQLTLEVSSQFVLAFASRKSMKLHVNISDDLFYGKHNPFKEPDFIMTLIDIASMAASPGGLDFIFDGLGAYYAFSIGENEQGMMYMVSLAIPLATGGMLREALVEGTALLVKGAKGSYKVISRKVYGLTFLLRQENEFSHLARSMLHPQSFNKLKAYSSELNFVEALEEGLLTEPKAAQAFNDSPELVDGFHEFHSAGKGTLQDFLRTGRIVLGVDDEIVTAISLLKKEEGWIDVVVHGDANSFIVWHNGTRLKLDHRRLLKYMESQGYAKGTPIRLLSCETGRSSLSIAQFLSDKANAIVKAPNVKIGITQVGELVALDGMQGEWKYFKPGQSTAYSATSVEKIQTILPNEKAFKLGIFDEELVDLLAVSKVLVDPTYEALSKYYKDEKFLSAMEDVIEISSEKTLKEFNDYPQLIDDLYKRFEKLGKNNEAFVQYYAEARRRISLLDQNTSFASIRKEYLSGETPRAFKEELTIEEEAVIQHFNDTGSRELNRVLRDGTSLTPYQEALKQTLQDGLAQLPEYEGIVYRGIDIPEATALKIQNLQPGGVILFKDFKTATASKETAKELSTVLNNEQYMFVIKSKSGTNIRQITGKVDREILFQPGIEFNVNSINRPFDDVFADARLVEIHVEEKLPGVTAAIRESGVLGPAITQALHELDAIELDPMVAGLIEDAVKTKNIEKLEELLRLKNVPSNQYIITSHKSYLANVPNRFKGEEPSVAYFGATERQQYELAVKNGKLFTKGEQLEEGATYIYVLAGDGKMYVNKGLDRTASGVSIHHSSFLSGENIVTGGELKIEDGKIFINGESGHYHPSESSVADAMLELIRRGADGKTLKFKTFY